MAFFAVFQVFVIFAISLEKCSSSLRTCEIDDEYEQIDKPSYEALGDAIGHMTESLPHYETTSS